MSLVDIQWQVNQHQHPAQKVHVNEYLANEGGFAVRDGTAQAVQATFSDVHAAELSDTVLTERM